MEYDVFFSYPHKDSSEANQILKALQDMGLKVWIDKEEIRDFESITQSIVKGLARSKVLLAYYSLNYWRSRACQWELTAAFIAAQSEGDPRKRVLIINPEETAEHIHPVELRDELFLTEFKDDEYLENLASRVKNHIQGITNVIGEIHALSQPRWYGNKGVGSNRFVGRLPVMWKIHSALHASGVPIITGSYSSSVVQVQGLGGVGKSLLTEEYAMRFASAFPGGVFWLRAYGNDGEKVAIKLEELEAERTSQIFNLAIAYGISVKDLSPEEIEAKLSQELERNKKPFLWVVDDIPTGLKVETLKRWFAPNSLGKTLITTRSKEYSVIGKIVTLGVFEHEEAYDLLTLWRKPEKEEEENAALMLLKDLGHHALAIDVTGAVLRASEGIQSISKFREELANPTSDELELASELTGMLPTGHEKSISSTLFRSIERLGQEGRDFLCLASLLAATPIPPSLVSAVFSKVDNIDELSGKRRAMLALSQAESLSLVEKADDEPGARLVHVLISRTIQFKDLLSERIKMLHSATVRTLITKLSIISDSQAHQELRLIITHARKLVSSKDDISTADLMGWVARYDQLQGSYKSAETLLQHQLDIQILLLGDENLNTLTTMNNLATVFHNQGDYSGARKIYEHVLEIRRNKLGNEHPDTLNSMSNLATALHDQGNYAGARKLKEQILMISKKVLGDEHPVTLNFMTNLATTLSNLGDYVEARKIYERVLAIQLKVLGNENSDTLRTMNNLATTLSEQGDYAGAKKIYEQTLEIQRKVLGDEHPDTLKAISNFATMLRDQGDYAGARKIYEPVLEIQLKLLGNEHPQTLNTMSNLATALHEQGDYAGAREILEQVLEIQGKVLGDEHPATLNSMTNLASTLHDQGNYFRARKIYEQVLEIQWKILGDEHPNLLITMNNLATVLHDQGDYVGARKLKEQVLKISQKVLGDEHPATLNSMSNLATTLYIQGDYAGAKKLFVQVLKIQRKVLGNEHLATLNTLSNLATMLHDRGNYAGARRLYERVLGILRKVLGDEHPTTLKTMISLATTISYQGDYAGSRELFEQVLEIQRNILGDEHPDTLVTMNNLATTLCNQGDHVGARRFFEQVFELRLKVHGDEHPDTLTTMTNLAGIYKIQGEYNKAEQFFIHVLKIRTKILGLEHPDSLYIIDNLVNFYKDRGESKKELIFRTRANDIRNELILKESLIDNGLILNTSEIESSIITAREFIAKCDYKNARNILKDIVKLPEYQKSIEEEFGFLYDFAVSCEEDEKKWSGELFKYLSNLWYVLSDKNTFTLVKEINVKEELQEEPKKINEQREIKEESKEASIQVDNLIEIKNKKYDGKSQEKGEILENAVFKLFREFFVIADDYEVKWQELRKQKAGTQFGFDISLECSLKENVNVKCHIECKNVKEIKSENIVYKLHQTKISYPNIDHWILICPTAEPENELHQIISKYNDTKELPFNIQIWSPNRNVKEFFGLNPTVYDIFFEPNENEIHPSHWTTEKRLQVFKDWKDKLKPFIRLPKEWDRYLRDPNLMCFKGENQKELDFIYKNHVQMECMDERKNILNKSLEEYVREWLNDNQTPLMFLLGEFGDGKSVFTYILSRKLAEEYYQNPSDGWIPIRFTLREYCKTRNSQKFLKERLERFDANFVNWNKVKESNRVLVILDGFDELTKKLDSDSITKHIKVLKDCCEEFINMKIIVTSRTHFLDKQRDKDRLLQRLPAYHICYLAPINRKSCLNYLENSVGTPEEKQKLKNIEKMHDPIGLASKPLFLQMIRQTLSELPENNLNEVILYKTYIEKTLNRKIELLDDDKLELLPDEICSNMIKILETIAIKLQISNQEFICLAEEFSGQKEKDLAKCLWQISDSSDVLCKNIEDKKANIEDATARVGIRSLLTRVKTEENDIKWPVDFCHRSMREYFVARGICSALLDDVDKARELLGKLQLNPEILYFSSEIMKENSKRYEEKLSQIIFENRSKEREMISVGNIATLLYLLKGELPGEDWSYLNLEGANLTRANLSGKNFFSTNLRNSFLDNVNFEMADFRECDLTGVRIEETSKALSIALHPSGSIIAAYEDNIVRELKRAQRYSKLEYRNLGKYKKGLLCQLFSYSGSDLCFLMNEEIVFYDYSNTNELKQKACFRIKPEYKRVLAKKDGLILLSEDETQVKKVLYVDNQHRIVCSKEIEDLIAYEVLDQQAFVIATKDNNIKIICQRDGRETITLEAHELTCLCTFCLKRDEKYLIAWGQRNGDIMVWEINVSVEKFQYEPLLKSHIHDGIVSSIAFLDETRIISSGLDRKILIQRYKENSENIQEVSDLSLKVRCRGMKIEGLKGPIEKKMLEELISKA